ncbi:MAG: hemolysin family protein [Pyrinomonadaceae bacterium MAG19_C2-C3]|nr:hemolysin family protein [Pyrinomonadaceae bacterium MAG19_C2-C3]
MEIEILLTCLSLAALVFVATVDSAFSLMSDVGLRRLITEAEERPRPAGAILIKEITENRPRFRFALSFAIQTLLIAVSVLLTSIFFRLFPDPRLTPLAFVASFLIALVFRQIVPRLIAVRNPEKILLTTLPVARPLYQPIARLVFPRSTAAQKRNDQADDAATTNEETEDTDEDDIQALIDVGEEEGIIEEQEGELIHSIIEFGDTRVNEVMTPRNRIAALPLSASVRQARDLVNETKYSRLPVYRDQIDNVEGIIYVRDLLQCWSDGREDDTIESLLRPAYFVPETKPIAHLLQEMQQQRVQLAMVTDEYGGVEGLVTVEDILEEIVGEIEDEDTEHDEIVEIVEAEGGYFDVQGSTEIGKIELLFDMELEDDDSTTVAGVVINHLGKVPRTGSTFTFKGLDVEILEADERRVARLRLRRASEGVANGVDANTDANADA